jgi:hypothetical protein
VVRQRSTRITQWKGKSEKRRIEKWKQWGSRKRKQQGYEKEEAKGIQKTQDNKSKRKMKCAGYKDPYSS